MSGAREAKHQLSNYSIMPLDMVVKQYYKSANNGGKIDDNVAIVKPLAETGGDGESRTRSTPKRFTYDPSGQEEPVLQ
jgi:hypothetical protein